VSTRRVLICCPRRGDDFSQGILLDGFQVEVRVDTRQVNQLFDGFLD
jgi:hypothetical protein